MLSLSAKDKKINKYINGAKGDIYIRENILFQVNKRSERKIHKIKNKVEHILLSKRENSLTEEENSLCI